MIEIKNLEKIFQYNSEKKVIFSGFNFSINKNEVVGLFGPNGSGKTTLLNILSGVDTNFHGQMKLDSKRIAYVHQDPSVTLAPWFSCEKNILLAREFHNLYMENGKIMLKQLSEEFRINFSLQQYPFSLSGGQRQIVTLMRALILEPDILLLDEPLSALDVKKRTDVMRVLSSRLAHGITVIISSHRGDDIKQFITRAVTFESLPAKIEKNISQKDFKSREEFEGAVSEINFKKNEG